MSRVPSPLRPRARAVASSPAVAGFRPAGAALAIAAAFGLQPGVQAQPTGAQVVHGQATFARDGANLAVTTGNGAGTSHSAINWQSFSVPAGSLTHFNQPSTSSTSINRVVGNDPSAIFGTLSSNGRLVLVNPAGIAVGQGAVVDTAGFTASTLGMTDADAIAGRARFAGAGGALQVDGKVVARHGDVVLIAPQVQTGAQALVQSAGATVLAAGQKVELTGRGLEGIRLEVQAPADAAVNLGQLKGDAVGIFAGTLRHSGVVQAQAVSSEGGKVVLRAAGDNLVSGTVTAAAQGGKGGAIDVLGDRVGLLAGAKVQANGAAGGGTIRVGGDYQGANAEVPNASRTYVDGNARIEADATGQGDGGRVIVWSDEVTRMHGQISARGGSEGGNGGFAEVSGKKYLEFGGLADLRAPQGQRGALLLDPEDIDIIDGVASDSVNTFPTSDPAYPGAAVFEPSSTGTVTLADGHLNLQLESSEVVVKTSSTGSAGTGGQITLQTGADVNWTSGTSLTLQADKGITVHGQIRGNGNVHLQALGGNIEGTGSVQAPGLFAEAWQGTNSSGGRISLTGANQVGTIAALARGDAAEFTFANQGALTIGSVSTPFASSSGISTPTTTGMGSIDVRTVNGALAVAPGESVSGGAIRLESGGANSDLLLGASGGESYFYTHVHGDGLVQLRAGRDVRAGWSDGTNHTQAALYGGSAATGGLAIEAGRNVLLDMHAYLSTDHAPIAVVAGNDLLAGGSMYTSGGLNGSITLTAPNGRIEAASLNSYGSESDPQGGSITLRAKGDVRVTNGIWAYGYDWSPLGAGTGGLVSVTSEVGNVELQWVDVSGGYGSSPSAGGNGGSVTVTALGTGSAAGQIRVGDIHAVGGDAAESAAGHGGSITIHASGDIQLANIGASGGWGGGNDTGGFSGGNGGTVDVSSQSGKIQAGEWDPVTGDPVSYASIVAGGGYGGAATSLASGSGGMGGAGGQVSLSAPGGSIRLTFVSAEGGDGGWGGDGSTFGGGAGGAAGRIALAAGAGLDLGGFWLNAIGGYGGAAGALSTGPGGAGGAGGAIDLHATGGTVLVPAAAYASLHAAQGDGGLADDGTAAASGTSGTARVAGPQVDIQGGLDFSGRAEVLAESPGGTVRVGAGGHVASSTDSLTIRADGDVTLDGIVGSSPSYASASGSLHLASAQGSIRQAAGGAIGAQHLVAEALNGSLQLEANGNEVGTIAATAGGAGQVLAFRNTGPVQGSFTTAGADVRIGADGTLVVTAASIGSAGGGIALSGGQAAPAWGDGISIADSSIDAGTGAVVIHGRSQEASSYGVRLEGSVHLSGGTVEVAGDHTPDPLYPTTAGGGVRVGGPVPTLVDGNGAFRVMGRTSGGGEGVLVTGSTVHRSGTVHIRGESAAGVGTRVGDGGATVSGTDVVITGNTANASGVALEILNDRVEATRSVHLRAENGSLAVVNSTVDNSGTGPVVMEAVGGPFAVHLDATSAVTSVGEIHVRADQADIDGTLSSSSRVMVLPENLAQRITLGGLDDGTSLDISQGELDRMSGSVIVVGGGMLTGGISVESPIHVTTAPGLSLINQGAIGQAAGATLVTNSLNADGGTVVFNEIQLGGASGGSLSGRAHGGEFTVRNAGTAPLRLSNFDGIAGIRASGRVTVSTHGELLLADPVHSDAAGTAIVLAGSSFRTNSPGSLSAPNGRWLVFAAAPTAALAGSPVSGHHAVWNTAYSATAPDALAAGGDRYVFAQQPVVNVTADAATRVYNGTPDWNPLTYSVTGLVDAAAFGNVFLQDAVTGALAIAAPGKDVGSYAIVQGSLAAPADYAVGFTGNTATITPAALTISASNLSKYEGDTLAFQGTEFTASGLVAGERVTSVALGSAGAAAEAPSGSYAIRATGVAGDNGFLASNYAITYLDGALAVMPAMNDPIVQQVSNQVVAFTQLFVQEAAAQQQEAKKNEIGRDDVVLTDPACTP